MQFAAMVNTVASSMTMLIFVGQCVLPFGVLAAIPAPCNNVADGGDECSVTEQITDEMAMLQGRVMHTGKNSETSKALSAAALDIETILADDDDIVENGVAGPQCGSDEETRAIYDRFGTLGTISSDGADSVFPDAASSIGSGLIGTTLIFDASQNKVISAVSDNWATVDEIAGTIAQKPASLFGSNGPVFSDIKQGKSGSCYFLAAIAAVAQQRPEFIQTMFTHQDLWGSGIYTVRFYILGKPYEVAVNNKLPADPTTKKPYFADSENGVFWGPILQKAWAKIYGSYDAMGSGWISTAFQAMSPASQQSLYHAEADDASTLWDAVTEALGKGYVIGAGSNSSLAPDVGLRGHHAYAILGMRTDISGHPQVLRLFDPHGRTEYSGVLKSYNPTTDDGSFYITLDEYLLAFQKTCISRMIANAVVSSISTPYSPADPVQLEFHAPAGTQIVIHRPLGAFVGCKYSSSYTRFIEKVTSTNEKAENRASGQFFVGSDGTYQLYHKETFLLDGAEITQTRLPWFSITAYGTESVDIAPKCMDRLEKFGGTGWTGDLDNCKAFYDNKFCNVKFDFHEKYYDTGVAQACQATCGAPGRGCQYAKSADSQCDSIAALGYVPIAVNDAGATCRAAAAATHTRTDDGQGEFCSKSYPGACHDYRGYLDWCSTVNAGVQKSKVNMICQLSSVPYVQVATSAGLVTTTTTTTTVDLSCGDVFPTVVKGCKEYTAGTRRRYSCATFNTDQEQCDYYKASYCARGDGVSGDDRRRRRSAQDAYDHCKGTCGKCGR